MGQSLQLCRGGLQRQQMAQPRIGHDHLVLGIFQQHTRLELLQQRHQAQMLCCQFLCGMVPLGDIGQRPHRHTVRVIGLAQYRLHVEPAHRSHNVAQWVFQPSAPLRMQLHVIRCQIDLMGAVHMQATGGYALQRLPWMGKKMVGLCIGIQNVPIFCH